MNRPTTKTSTISMQEFTNRNRLQRQGTTINQFTWILKKQMIAIKSIPVVTGWQITVVVQFTLLSCSTKINWREWRILCAFKTSLRRTGNLRSIITIPTSLTVLWTTRIRKIAYWFRVWSMTGTRTSTTQAIETVVTTRLRRTSTNKSMISQEVVTVTCCSPASLHPTGSESMAPSSWLMIKISFLCVVLINYLKMIQQCSSMFPRNCNLKRMSKFKILTPISVSKTYLVPSVWPKWIWLTTDFLSSWWVM